jgi:hypothetical protein
LSEHELALLNRIVAMDLDYAELQALRRVPMNMNDWQERMNRFLTVSDLEILDHSGNVTHDAAERKAHIEYERFRSIERERRTAVEDDFEEIVSTMRQVGKGPNLE